MKILTMIVTPDNRADELAKAWLQHVRNFDAAHPECHFEILMQEGETISIDKAIDMLADVSPPIPVAAVMKT